MKESINEKKINITAAPGVSEIIIREGHALPVHEPGTLNITGTIDAPLRFLKNRYVAAQLNALDCHILVNKEKGYITLVIDEKNHYCHGIAGMINVNESITKFGINNGKYVTPDEMSNFLRERKHLFESQAQYSDVFSALRTFKARVDQQINSIRDDSGNYDLKRKQAVEHNVPKSFKLCLPIFKGMPKITFEVEVLVNNSLEVTLYSTELIQLTDELRDKYVSDVVDEIEKVSPDIVIIYQ